MSKKIRFFAFLLSLVFLLLSFAACSAKESEEELLSIAKSLTEASVSVNEMTFGEGILPLKDGYSISSYTEADPESLAAYGVSNLADIKSKIRSVYAYSTAAWIETTTLSSVKQDGQVLTYTRYYDDSKLDGAQSTPVLMVKDNYEPLVKGKASYSNYKLVKIKKSEVVFTVDITVKDGETVKEFPASSVTMRKEDGKWLLDSTTYASVK